MACDILELMYPPSPVKKIILLLLASFVLFCNFGGCAVIAGSEDQALTPPYTLTFVETLINQKSLTGESYRNLPNGGSSVLLQKPTSVYADSFRVYVTDRNLNPAASVIVFDRGARKAGVLNITPPPGSSPNEGALLAPVSIAVAPTNVIYVADVQQGRVFGYDLNGRLVMTLGRPQAHAAPIGNGRSFFALREHPVTRRNGRTFCAVRPCH